MILGRETRSIMAPPAGVLVTTDMITGTRGILEDLAIQQRGGKRLAMWQRYQIRRLAPMVAARKAQGIEPMLSAQQAMQLYKIAHS